MKKNLLAVRFIQPTPPYLAGEQAGFPEARAFQLVRARRAVFVKPPDGFDESANRLKPEPKAAAKKKAPAKKKAGAKKP